MNITVYETQSGQIVRVCSVSSGAQHLQAGYGEDWLEGNYPDDRFYIANGQPVAMPSRPSAHHNFNYATKQWVADTDGAWGSVRAERNKKLRDTDWTQMPDSPFAAQQRQQWAAYRQALRDVTNQADPFTINWPTPPEQS